uniref:uncharacterized protein isoform X2 n=1 Tax=Pristiophorus japonicus TaxID=55135 RepID=UPI00398F7672
MCPPHSERLGNWVGNRYRWQRGDAILRDTHLPPSSAYLRGRFFYTQFLDIADPNSTPGRSQDGARRQSAPQKHLETAGLTQKKTSAIAADQRHMGGGPTTQEPLTNIEIHALSLVEDSNCATTGIGADPLTQDDLDDSVHTNTDDKPTASTSGITQPSPDFTPDRDEEDKEEQEQEEPLILHPVEVGVEMEEDTPAPCGPAGTSQSLYSGDFPHGSSDSARPNRVQQHTPSFAAPLLQRGRLVQERLVAVDVYQDIVRLSQASVDIGHELLKARTMIATNIVALSERSRKICCV